MTVKEQNEVFAEVEEVGIEKNHQEVDCLHSSFPLELIPVTPSFVHSKRKTRKIASHFTWIPPFDLDYFHLKKQHEHMPSRK